MKLVIGGGTRCGKTTLARMLSAQLGLPVYHSDDLAWLGWSAASDVFADAIEWSRDGIFEGVAAVRSLRKLLARSDARPCTRYLHLSHPVMLLTQRQKKMNANIETIWRNDVRTPLIARKVEVMHHVTPPHRLYERF